jgi:ATP-binding cassette, subfamily B, bacterial HlyB/CyaB
MSVLTSPLHAALRCLFIIALHHGLEITPQDLISGTDAADPVGSILKVMKRAGFKGSVLKNRKWKAITSLGSAYPAMAGQKDGNWVVVVNLVALPGEDAKIAILDPMAEQAGVVMVDRDQFMETWDGTIVLCKRIFADVDSKEPFGFRWFLPEIMLQGRYYRDIGIAAITANVIGYFTPFLLQIMIDKVVSHKSYNTLVAVMVVFTVLTIFDCGFGYVRQNLMLYASTKIDARLASRTFGRLLNLPLTFFETNTAGVLIRNMQQTDSIRNFLTGRLFSTGLDMLPMPILLVMLGLYSFTLTMVVLAFSAAIAGCIALMLPIFKHHLDQLYQVEGARQGHLVETIHGMRTVKSLVLGPHRLQEWDLKVAQSMRRLMTVGRVGTLGNTATHFLERLMQLAILGVGAQQVFDGSLSIGALVAFNMLSGRVSGPLIALVGLINEYQQVSLSVKMLGTVMDHPPEREAGQRYIYPKINGEIEFDEVTFRYPGTSTPALDRVSFKVVPGQMIGVVGRSGSGKSTLTRLIQGIHPPDSGLLKISGADIRHIDLSHLRRNIGVVLQDNFLFRGTMRDNISATKPEASMEEIMESSRMAGAAEFIDRLPNSYNTFVQENASNFSGGQRQRVAIARALLPKPQLMIFDEATSALDPESEAIVQENLDKIAEGRTMVVVSHRLSSLVQADAILVLEQGKVMDFAPHHVLLERCEIYRHLWEQQTRHIS